MQSNSNKICYVCGKKYRYCSNCPEYTKKPSWMNTVCCEECHDIFSVCAKFNLGYFDKVEAMDLLGKYNPATKIYGSKNINATIANIFEGRNDNKAVHDSFEASEQTPKKTRKKKKATSDDVDNSPGINENNI